MKYCLFICLFCTSVVSAFAQSQTAHVYFNSIVQALPEAQIISDTLARQAAQLQQRIASLQQEAKRQQAQLQQEAMTLNETVFQVREKQVEELFTQARQFREQAQRSLK